MSQLPIRKLTLYKQGIGYFERQGEFEGNLLSLTVPRDSVNDVLKSLSITVLRGGAILGVDYETPEDKQKILAGFPIQLAARSSLVDLLSGLRGSRVTLRLEQDRGVSGHIVGVEASLDSATNPAQVVLQSEENPAQIDLVPVATIRGVSLHDEQAATDVRYLLEVNRTEQTRTTLTVRLSESSNSLQLGYLAPCPTWRVGYRLMGDGKGQARLLAWGVLDNWLDEDLDNVDLTLLSGRPITFEYQLMETHRPARPEVSDVPSALETMAGSPLLAESLGNISHELRTPLNSIIGFASILEKDGELNKEQKADVEAIAHAGRTMLTMVNNLLDMARLQRTEGGRAEPAYAFYRSGPLGDLKVSNAYFRPVTMGNAEPDNLTYKVETPVSIRRGQSAMVPLVDQVVAYEESCVYNGDKMPNHPLRVWRIQNTTGRALEQGPVTLGEDGRYLGEGLVRFTGVGDVFHVPYALEFGIFVSHSSKQRASGTLRVRFDSKQREAVVTRFEVLEHEYVLASHVDRDVTVFVERRDPQRGETVGGEYFEMPEPALAAEGHSRWPVTVPAQGTAETVIKIRTTREKHEDVDKWDRTFIQDIRAGALLPEAALSKLETLLEEKQAAVAAADRLKLIQAEYDQVVSRQDQLRKNLDTLGDSERERTIRNHVLDDLESSENRRRELEQTIADLQSQIKQHRQSQQTLIGALYAIEG